MADVSRRNFTKMMAGGIISSAAVTSTIAPKNAQAAKKKPNIVFICSDQHSYKVNGFMGHPIVRTPNLDRIAKEGVVFDNAYSGHPVCTPGRASMMTGMFAHDSNSFCNSTVWDGSQPLWSNYLKGEGYYCRAIGKLDLSDEHDTGFEEIETSHGHQYKPDITSLFRRPVAYRVNERPNVDGKPRNKAHKDAQKTQLGLDFLQKEAKDKKQPWALYVGLTQPHPAFVALKKYYDMYPTYSMDMPNIPPGFLEEQHLVYQELQRFKRIATPISEERIRKARAAYYGMVSELDEYVGKIYNELKQSGELENTLFIYTSDHGESLGEHGLWFKNNLYDMAARVPLVMAGAGLPKGKRVNAPVAHVDVAASMLDLAGSDGVEKLRGHSLIPMVFDQKGDHPGYAFSECHSEGNATGSYMIRKGDWKYIHFTWYDDMLFNMKDDPGEFNNLIDDPAAQDVRKELEGILNSLVDADAVTLKAFKAQEEKLNSIAKDKSVTDLFELFKGRLGDGLAMALAMKTKGN